MRLARHFSPYWLALIALGGVQAVEGGPLSTAMNPVISNQDWPGKACLWIQALSGYTSGLFHRKKHIFGIANWAKNPWSSSQHAPGVKLLLFCFAKLIASSCRLNLYTHRRVQLSDLVREVSLCSRWQLLTHEPTPGQREETV